ILGEGTQPSPSVTMPDLSVAKAPRLSLVVRPFTNLSGNSDEDYLAEMIAEDVSTDLSNLPDLMVIGQASAARFKDRGVGAKQIGERLGVRYVVEGSVRKLGDVIRVSAQLISTETSSAVWAGRFDQSVQDLALGQEEIASRVAEVLGAQMYYAESARSLRERPDNPDAADLFMRGYSLWRKGADAHRAEASALFEQALELDPKSTSAICALADELINSFVMPEYHNRGDENLLERTRPLVAAAAAIEPHSQRGMRAQANLLRAQGRWDEAGALYQTILEIYPNGLSSYRLLGFTKMALGQAEEAIQLLQRSIRLDPLTPFNRASIQRIGNGLLLLGRDEEAIEWLQRAIAAGGSAPPPWRAQCNLFLASAFALTGQSDKARTAIAQANRLWPFATVRSLPPTMTPRGIPHPLYLEQMRHVQEGFRLAGLRDHAEEEADSGVAPVGGLQTDLVAPTPRDVPGVKTIRTAELGELLAQTTPLLIDVALDSWGYSLPGAVGLQGIGHGAAFSEALQARFARKIHSLTDGDKTKPIVVFCVNSERFTGYNAALRLAALGYTDVRWYRGGVEAWEVNGLPESAFVLQAW
ncbi:MAG TPA: tetratricopeptide repeat protein, partial [Acetobacteraceae bacterium]